ncbi:glycosyltransferase [Neobacillus sp. YIM B06451]|uniref:glycosyltransferase n=1 Tax=Neobacillus sp. YIM B06451 TaxID=3070994 RepID=UPI00292CF61C|nr:glycosyltransferase [Neobacillus sp. YIM B06451]
MNKKVLFVLDRMVMGGVEVLLLDILRSLDAKKYSITVMSLFDGGELVHELPKTVNHVFLFKKQYKGIYRLLRFIPPRLLYKKLNNQEFDIEISFKTGIPEKIVAASRNRQSKKIAWIHGDMEYQNFGLESHITKKKQTECYNKFDFIITVSEKCRRAFMSVTQTETPVEKIYNAIIPGKIDTKLSEDVTISMDKNLINLITIARLHVDKGIDRLIRAFCKGYAKNNRLRLYIIGHGPEEKKLRKLAQELNVHEAICFLGKKLNPYVYLREASIYIHPAHSEPFGIVVIEALYMGLPVVSTKCGGPDEILSNGKYGLLVENSQEGLNEALLRIAENHEEILSLKNDSKSRASHFTMNNMMEEVIGLLDEK